MVNIKGFIIILGVSFLSFSSLYAEVDLDATLIGTLTASKIADENITSSGTAGGNLTVKSTGSKDVKSQLTIDFTTIRNMEILSISKAWVKFRYPLLRVTIGKNRISWGEGAAFNAGDVIFDDYKSLDSETEDIDLTADELRSENRTMGLITFPLGRFTFIEGIYLPYDFFTLTEIGEASSGVLPEDKELFQHSGGGRFVTKLAGIKLETGYIYNGSTSKHKPYVSFNGTLGVDYHLSASVNIKHNNSDFEEWKDSFKISTGSFYLFDLENDKTLTLRLESLIKPFENWETEALNLYPEISFVPNNELSFFIRGIVNPLDVNIKGTFGVNWKTYQGFSIATYYTGEIDNEYEQSLTAVVTHKF